ncbi:MAG: copper resistance protein CopC, partial [Nitrosopumilaceae archaeon]
MKKLLTVVFFVFVFSFGSAQGHPFIVETEPAQSSNISLGINQIIIHYSEAVEEDYSTIKVFDKNGNQVDNKDTAYFQGEDSLVVTTEPLSDGVYT